MTQSSPRSTYCLKLINPTDVGEILHRIKDKTIEEKPFFNVYDHIAGGEIRFVSDQNQLTKYRKAKIFPASDFIVINDFAIWPKSSYSQFSKIIPLDENLVSVSQDKVILQKPARTLHCDHALSLCGVHADIWAHFLVQYLPKLDYLQYIDLPEGEKLTVFIPSYRDHQIREIIDAFLGQDSKLEVVELSGEVEVLCQSLYHINHTAILSDHSSYCSPSDILIPEYVISFLKDKFVNNTALFTDPGPEGPPTRKIFISRENSIYRNMENDKQIEAFFVGEGFESILPHQLSLSEKKKLFEESKFIVGTLSSGFTNILFCRPGTKILGFVNFQRIYDTYLPLLARDFNIDLLVLTGEDLDPSNINSDFHIHLDKIKQAYREFCTG